MKIMTTEESRYPVMGIVTASATAAVICSDIYRTKALKKAAEGLELEAEKLGANAVIGVQFMEAVFADQLYITAVGTAVKEPELTVPDSL